MQQIGRVAPRPVLMDRVRASRVKPRSLSRALIVIGLGSIRVLVLEEPRRPKDKLHEEIKALQ